MKRSVLLIVCIFSFAATGFAQRGNIKYKGEKGISSAGGIVGYAIDCKAALIGADYRYNIHDRIRLAPSVLYTLNDEHLWYVNADAHYLARITDKITLYPVGGLGLSIRNVKIIPTLPIAETSFWNAPDEPFPLPESEEDKSETETHLGINIGFGGEMRITKDLIVGVEFRNNLTTKRIYDQAMFSARAAYYF
jgi:opacity protein-like surface antigen